MQRFTFRESSLTVRFVDRAPFFNVLDLRGLLGMSRWSSASTPQRDIKDFPDGAYVSESVACRWVRRCGTPDVCDWFWPLVGNLAPPGRTHNTQVRVMTESDLHETVVRFCRTYFPDTVLIPGLGEMLDTDDRRICAWRKGYTRGTTDLLLVERTTKYCGLAFEFKTPTGFGSTTDDQDRFHARLVKAGWKVLVSDCYDEIILAIAAFMEHRRVVCPKCATLHRSHQKLGEHLSLGCRLAGTGGTSDHLRTPGAAPDEAADPDPGSTLG